MPKVTGPLFSVEGMGSIGDGITFTRCPKGHRAILRPRHKDASTAAQSVVRSSFIAARSAWRTLSAGSKAYYNAEGNKLHMSGYNFYIRGVLLGEISLGAWVNYSLDRQVGASTDDGLVLKNSGIWTISLTSNTNIFGYGQSDLNHYGGGHRFTNVTVPKGAVITSAYLQFMSEYNTSTVNCRAKIIGDKEANAASFSTLADYQARRGTSCGGANNNLRTVAEAEWNNVAAWTAGQWYNSPDISSVIQEIIDQAAWASGNAMALFCDDHDDRSDHVDNTRRFPRTYNKGASYAAKLHIQYKVWES